MAETGFSVCHCSVSSAAGLGDASESALLTEQWHTAPPIATIPGYTPQTLRDGKGAACAAAVAVGSASPNNRTALRVETAEILGVEFL